ncbi:MAG TPA: SRPBCC family protein [Gemmatimonadales bacterium]|nr:SRPBCC family protein [Gemmatimonadales bacterium]
MEASIQEAPQEAPKQYERRYTEGAQPRRWDDDRLARGLGWFSLGLGLTQLAAPRGVARLIGLQGDDEDRKAMIAIGMRELASGIGILAQRRPGPGVWARVSGDVMDLALLGRAINSNRADRNRVAMATAAVAGVTLIDLLAGQRLRHRPNGGGRLAEAERAHERGVVLVRRAITVNRTSQEVYEFWRNFENLPQFMAHLEAVRILDDRRSHWIATGPAGSRAEWDAEIVEDRPNERIVWRAVPDSEVPNEGSVRFVPAPGGRGTEIHVELRYSPPGGRFAAKIAKLFGEEPGQQVAGDLRRFKQVMELGEVVHSDASIHRGMHPARPSNELPRIAPSMEGAVR